MGSLSRGSAGSRSSRAPSGKTRRPTATRGRAPPPVPCRAQDLAQVKRIWPSILDKLAEKAPALAATFDGARPIAFDDDDLTIGFPPDQPFNKRKAESPDRRQALIDAFAAVIGGPVAPRYVLLEEDAPSRRAAARHPGAGQRADRRG